MRIAFVATCCTRSCLRTCCYAGSPYSGTVRPVPFLDAFAKYRKVTVSFVVSVCLSVSPHGTIRLPLVRFSWNLIFEHFRYFFEYVEVSLTSDKNNGYFTWRPIYIACWILRMRNVSGRIYRENQTHILYSISFLEKCAVHEIMWKNIVQTDRPQMTIWRMRVAYWIPKVTNTHSEYYCFSTATVVARTSCNLTLYIQFLFWLN